MIENLQDELYQLENKQAKGTKLRANIRWELEGEKCSKTFFKVLKRQNMQNQAISELYTDDNESKYSSSPKDISPKTFYEKLYTKAATFWLLLLNFLAKFQAERKYLMNNLTFVRRKYL